MRSAHRLRESPDMSAALLRALATMESHPLNEDSDLAPLLKHIGERPYVLLGEASHGTHAFYTWRAALSQRLIEEKGFTFIGVEGDWPDCYRVNRYVKGFPDAGGNAREVLHAFNRWPTWMWANEEVVDFVEWLREFNDSRPAEKKVGFYGLDVYSLWDSLYAVLNYLHRQHPEAVHAAWQALRCFEPYGENVEDYARATAWVPNSCEDEVISLLTQLRGVRAATRHDNDEPAFEAEQNALVLKNAEAYYRTMIHGGPESWNIRDRHMAATFTRLIQRHGPEARGIAWEHNTHIGDARFTDMADAGMVNLGQLVRERNDARNTYLVGFGSHHGSVIAAKQWDDPMEILLVPEARVGSWEALLHEQSSEDRVILFSGNPAAELLQPRGHRAIGVVYHPDYEAGNYVPTVLPRRYDAFIYLEETHALRPLHMKVQPDREVPETYPTGV